MSIVLSRRTLTVMSGTPRRSRGWSYLHCHTAQGAEAHSLEDRDHGGSGSGCEERCCPQRGDPHWWPPQTLQKAEDRTGHGRARSGHKSQKPLQGAKQVVNPTAPHCSSSSLCYCSSLATSSAQVCVQAWQPPQLKSVFKPGNLLSSSSCSSLATT